MRLVIDNNIWLSFAIGKRLADLPQMLTRPGLELFAGEAQLAELLRVLSRPKFLKYISPARKAETLHLMKQASLFVPVLIENADFSDPKDNYLLDLCQTILADFLVTGDLKLLELGSYPPTKIISFSEFREMIGGLDR